MLSASCSKQRKPTEIMASFSKFFQEHIKYKNCQSLLHVESCQKHLRQDILRYALSNFKYCAPICLIPALVKIRNMNRERLLDTLKYYIEVALVSTSVGYSINSIICVFRNLLGFYGFYTMAFIPAAIGGYCAYLGSPRTVRLFETSILQCSVETFLLLRRNVVSRAVADSHFLQTLIFMFCSCIILHSKLIYGFKGFWLLTPNYKNPSDVNESSQKYEKCGLHPKTNCRQHLWNGIRKCLIIGLSLDFIKMLLSKVNTKSVSSSSKLWAKASNFQISSTALFTIYIGVYRFVHCFLNRNCHTSGDINHATASFLAGCSYYFNPQSTLFSYAIVEAVRSAWNILKINTRTENKIFLNILNAPYVKILYPLALGNAVHLFCMRPKYCSPLCGAIINGVTNQYPNHVRKQIQSLYGQYKKDMNISNLGREI